MIQIHKTWVKWWRGQNQKILESPILTHRFSRCSSRSFTQRMSIQSAFAFAGIGSGLHCWQILNFTYAYALIFIHRRFGSLFWLLGVLIGSLSQSLGVLISFGGSGLVVLTWIFSFKLSSVSDSWSLFFRLRIFHWLYVGSQLILIHPSTQWPRAAALEW